MGEFNIYFLLTIIEMSMTLSIYLVRIWSRAEQYFHLVTQDKPRD